MSEEVVVDRNTQKQVGLWPYISSLGVSGTATQSAQEFEIPDRSARQFILTNFSLDKYIFIRWGRVGVVADPLVDLPVRFDRQHNGSIPSDATHFSVVCLAGETAPFNLNSGWGFV